MLRDLMAATGTMEVKATKVPAIRTWLEREKLLAHVLGAISPASRQLLEHPPLPTSWVRTALIYEMYAVILRERGPGSVRKMGYETTMAAYSRVLKSLMSTLISLVGASPATILSRSDSLVHMFERGTEYTWESSGEHAGVITVRTAEPVGPEAWEAFESLAHVAMAFSKTEGRTRIVDVRANNREGRILVEW